MKTPAANTQAGIRPPAVAGRFYPDQPDELRRTVSDLFDRIQPEAAVAPKAMIAPHAGYIFSGPIAALAHARFMPDRHVIKRIVLIGPSHFVSFDGLAASSAEFFATPLGLVPVDTDAVSQLAAGLKPGGAGDLPAPVGDPPTGTGVNVVGKRAFPSERSVAPVPSGGPPDGAGESPVLPCVSILDEAHAREHSLEVQLPFLQVVLNNFKIVPLVTGNASDMDVAEVIAALWDGPETRFVISSDLSHYHNYACARELDTATSRAIEQLRPEAIAAEQACGRVPICGLLRSAWQHGLRARTVDLRNSGDTAGPRGEVVGYGAFVFEEHANRPAL